jgi:predicted GIY-YIG superfamily endonuclease
MKNMAALPPPPPAKDGAFTAVQIPAHLFQGVVYVLANRDGNTRTYVGVTNNLARRLRQHCGAISGGAKATRASKTWYVVFTVSHFASRSNALSFEWYMHHARRMNKMPKPARKTTPLQKRAFFTRVIQKQFAHKFDGLVVTAFDGVRSDAAAIK